MGDIAARMAFCQRCGDPVYGPSRCARCGGTGVAPNVSSSAPPETASRPDPWASRYVSGGFPSESSSSTKESGYLLFNDNRSTASSSFASASRAPPAANGSLGLGVPSRISRDLRTSPSDNLTRGRAQHRTSPSSPPEGSADAQTASASATANYPTVEGADGVLSKVCGTLVEPSSSRNRWACSGCNAIFARDATIYAEPRSGEGESKATGSGAGQGAYYCRACYVSRFALGPCTGCTKPVLGSTKEDGKYIKAGPNLYHGRCWLCTGCGRGGGGARMGGGVEIMLGIDGYPTCEGCFGKSPAGRRESARNHTDKERETQTHRDGEKVVNPRGAMGATIAELSKRFGAGSASGSTTDPTSPRIGRPASISSAATAAPVPLSRSPTRNGAGTTLSRSPSRLGLGLGAHSRSNSITGGLVSLSLSRSTSITGSPPKPRPLTAQFTGESFNLAAFRGLQRADSRTRSLSPLKRVGRESERERGAERQRERDNLGLGLGPVGSDSDGDEGEPTKVPGSPVKSSSLGRVGGASSASSPNALAQGSGQERERTASGFPRPLNFPAGTGGNDGTVPIEGHRSASPELAPEAEVDVDVGRPSEQERQPSSAASDDSLACAICGRGAFDGPSSQSRASGARGESREGAREASKQVTMVTLRAGQHLHAECFKCAICEVVMDPSRAFVGLEGRDAPLYIEGNGEIPLEKAFAHPHCAPPVRIERPAPSSGAGAGLGAAAGTSAGLRAPYESQHATHQRAPRASPGPSPGASRDPSPSPSPSFALSASPSRSASASLPASLSSGGMPAAGTVRSAGGLGASTSISRTRRFPRPGSPVRPRPFGGNTSTSTSDTQRTSGAVPAGTSASASTSQSQNLRRFVPSSGAAPLAQSTIRNSGSGSGHGSVAGIRGRVNANPAAGMFAASASVGAAGSRGLGFGAGAGGAEVGGVGGLGGAGGGWGGQSACPGCGKGLTPLECVPGPCGTKWHARCLVCGAGPDVEGEAEGATHAEIGASAGVVGRWERGRREKERLKKGCGKKLDSGAKVDRLGGVRCRACFDKENGFRI